MRFNYAAVSVAFVALMAALLLYAALRGPATTGLRQNLNASQISSVFLDVAPGFFSTGGYLVAGNTIATKFPQYGSGNISGYVSTDMMGDSSLGNKIIAFIYGNDSAPSEYLNTPTLESAFSFESNSKTTPLGTQTFGNITVHFYSIRTTLGTGNQSLTLASYGSAFSYRNILFVGLFENASLSVNVTGSLAERLSGG